MGEGLMATEGTKFHLDKHGVSVHCTLCSDHIETRAREGKPVKRLELEIEGQSVGDLYRMVRHLAENILRGHDEDEGEYVTGCGDGPTALYFYRITELEG